MRPSLKDYLQLLRFDRPIGILLLLWPTLWALWVAGKGHPQAHLVVIFVVGVITMRTAGCIINDIADRHFDHLVSRTRNRPLASGRVPVKHAWILFFSACLLAFILVLLTNKLTIALAFVGLLLAVIYPFTKRFTHWPQIVLGIAFAWGVPMAFAAQTNSVPSQAWLLYLASALWPIAYDTMYAMVDKEDDRKIGVRSTAVLLNHKVELFIAIVQLCVWTLLATFGLVMGLGKWYFLSLIIIMILFLYQQYLIRNHQPAACFRAFLNNHWVGLAIFMGIALGYLY